MKKLTKDTNSILIMALSTLENTLSSCYTVENTIWNTHGFSEVVKLCDEACRSSTNRDVITT